MSLNDRAAEASAALRDGAEFDFPEVRQLLLSIFDDAADGVRFPEGLRSAARAITEPLLADPPRWHRILSNADQRHE